MNGKPLVRNRKARFEYDIMEQFEAGIALVGTEVKSIRAGKVKIGEAYCQVTDDLQLEICQMEISAYDFGNRFNHDVSRKRKLLMHKKEIIRLYSKMREKGLTVVPLSLYLKKGRVKVEIALAKGKKLHDKRASIKEKDVKRDMARDLKI